MQKTLMIIFFVMSIQANANSKSQDSVGSCSEMINYALKKHEEYANGRSIEDLIKMEKYNSKNERQDYYRELVLEILDTFAIWENKEDKERVKLEIVNHFNSICDPKTIKDVF